MAYLWALRFHNKALAHAHRSRAYGMARRRELTTSGLSNNSRREIC